MIGKKINQLATELAPTTTDLTIIGDPVTGVSKKITLEQLGAIFGGAVSFYTTLGDFPATGVIDIIYCAKDTKKLYLWSGSAYVEVFPSQSLLDTYQLRSEKGVSNGYASLDVNGKVPIGQLPNSIMEYKGTWNAATNTPTLANGTGDTGDVYICNAAGTVNFGAGPITFAVGDYVVYSGTIWQRSSGAVGTVTSVGLTITGDSIGVTGSPITTSGTLALAFAGTGAQYIKGDGTLATFPSIISQAQNLVTEVYNSTGATLTKGTIVYINGGQGNLPTVTKALATGDSTSAQTYGVVQTDITNMNNGYVVVAGRLTDLDTQAYSNGTQLYLSATTAGTWTSTKQYAPNHLVYVGIVVRSHPTQGVVEIKIQNGYELDELHNVAAQSPDNNDILQYKTATSLWTKVAGTTSNIAEGTNLYYTDARSRAALSFTAGSGAYNSTTGVITIPTNTNQLTNGAAFITLASLSAGAGISYNNTTGVIASTITQYTDALARAAISLTTTGTSGAATYNNTTGVLNIPQYQTALTNPVTGTGTTNTLAKFTGSSTIGNSIVSESGSALSVAGSVTAGGTIQTTNGNGLFTRTQVDLTLNSTSTSQYGRLIFQENAVDKGVVEYINSAFGGFRAGKLELVNDGGITFITQGNFTSPNMFINGSGNVGIGTASPTERLHINNSSTNAAFIRFQNTGGDGVYVGGRNNDLEMYAGGSLKAIITSGGNVGIGTTSPNGKLNISNGGAEGIEFWVLSATATNLMQSYNRATSAWNSLEYKALDHIFYGSGSERMRITSGGNVGIGTTSPQALLETRVAGESPATGRVALIAATSNGLNDIFRWFDGTTQLGVFKNNGNVGIGTTSPAAKLEIQDGHLRLYEPVSTAGAGYAVIWASNNGGTNSSFATIEGVTTSAGNRTGDIKFNTSSAGAPTEKMRITSGGNVGIGVTNPQTQLHLNGTITFTESGFNTVRLNQIQSSHSDGSSPNNNIRFLVSNGSGTTAERMRINGEGALQVTSTIQTGAPANGTAQPWKLGNAVSGTVSPSHYLVVEINGQSYTINAFNGFP